VLDEICNIQDASYNSTYILINDYSNEIKVFKNVKNNYLQKAHKIRLLVTVVKIYTWT
jgi:hypothetical protein